MISRLANRRLVRVSGSGSSHFLQGLCTQDVSKLERSAFTCFLNAQGRVLFDAILTKDKEENLLIDVHADVSQRVVAMLQRYRLRLPIDISESSDLSVCSSSQASSGFFADPRYPSTLPLRGYLPTSDAQHLPDGTHAFRKSRILAGVPEGPEEFKLDSALPLNMNADLLNGVSFSKGCYVGQELTTRTYRRGVIRRRIFTLLTAGDSLALGEVSLNGEPVGQVISSEGGAALAQLHTPDGAALNDPAHAAKLIAALGPVSVAGREAQIIIPGYFRYL